jgi:hypothetical protein
MNRLRTRGILATVAITGIFTILLISCEKKPKEGMILVTQVSSKENNINYVNGKSWRYIPQSRIALFDPSKPGSTSKVLTSDFYSARSPEVSVDGKSMLFAGQKTENDPWQIWEMNLASLKFRKIYSTKNNCIDPAYLPLGGVVFSESLPDDSLKSGHSLFTGNLDGSDIRRITFNPHTYFASTVLSDGRILAISRQVFPVEKDNMFLVMRPDGTKSEIFYHGPDQSTLISRGWETTANNILFVETEKNNPAKGIIVSLDYNNPFASRKVLSSGTDGDFHSVFPEPSGKLLVTYRKSEKDPYGLYEFDPESKKLGQVLYSNNEFDVLEAVAVNVHQRPRKLPSEVHMDIKTGLIVCQDANLLDPEITAGANNLPGTYEIEVLGIDSIMGILKPESDGSFYLRVIADTPFKIRSIDKKGNVIQTCDWIWLRPNERRGCVGCHEDPELVPGNWIPVAVKKDPVGIPMHVNKIKEIMIDTE